MQNNRGPSFIRYILDPITWGAGMIIALLLVCLAGSAVWLFSPRSSEAYPTAIIQVIAAPTATATSIPTPTPGENDTGSNTESSGSSVPIAKGAYVQITGTGGDGLRLRSEPGLESEINFVAMDAEVFRVEDGPREEAGYTWWYLVAPYDASVRGWGVAKYLNVVQNP